MASNEGHMSERTTPNHRHLTQNLRQASYEGDALETFLRSNIPRSSQQTW
jgi:hypothetical protein